MTDTTASNPVVTEAPGPRGLPLIGNLGPMSRLGPIRYFGKLWQQLGDTFAVKVGPRRMLVVVHPDAVEHVLITHRENYLKERTYDGMRLLTGDGLLTMEGEPWRARRKLEAPSFHRGSIEKLVATMARVTDEALTRMRARIPQGGIMDAHQEMMRLTLDVVSETLFGQRVDVDRADASGAAFGEVLQQVSDRGNSPVQLPLGIPTPKNRRFRRALKTLDEETYAIIDRARAQKDHEQRPTLLAMLLDSKDADTGLTLSNLDLRNEVITLFLAGHETTALTLTWAFTLLGRHPDVVQKMREEVLRVVGNRTPTMADCMELTYVRQCVDEILRLRCPVWTVARDAAQDDVIGGVRVHAGDVVMPMSYLTHRHPQFWEDPERFDPERHTTERARARPKGAYYPFSIGPRVCIGNTFSLVETQVVLAMLLQRAEFSMATDKEIPLNPAVTLRPGAEVPVRLNWLT